MKPDRINNPWVNKVDVLFTMIAHIKYRLTWVKATENHFFWGSMKNMEAVWSLIYRFSESRA